MMDTIRRHYVFSGSVQGVGFRWRAKHAAERRRITGWVRNLWDGTVEMEAEGTEADLTGMLMELQNNMWIDIEDIDSRKIPAEGGYGFEIR